MFTTSGIQRLYDVSPQTVRNWTNEFQKYLSASATPKEGKRRQFTIGDLTVFSLVKEMTDKGFTYEEVHTSLEKGNRGEVPEAATSEGEENELHQLSPEEIGRSLALIKERDQALGRIEQLIIENDKKDEQIKDLNDQISKLNREIGKLEARIEIAKESDDDVD